MSAVSGNLLEVADLVWGHHGEAFGGPWSAGLGAGQALAVLGPNGAGKTTLFRTLVGTVPALSGHISWMGRSGGVPSPAQLAACVAFVPQQAGAALELSVGDYAMLGRMARKGWFARPDGQDRDIVAHALERLGIAQLARRALGGVSGGERQLAAMARALAQQPAVLMLDEPTASLDFSNQQRVLSQVESLVADGLAVVFSTHQPEQAHRLATHVLAVDGRGPGRFGAPQEILTEAVLSGLYGVPVVRFEVRGHILFSVDLP